MKTNSLIEYLDNIIERKKTLIIINFKNDDLIKQLFKWETVCKALSLWFYRYNPHTPVAATWNVYINLKMIF